MRAQTVVLLSLLWGCSDSVSGLGLGSGPDAGSAADASTSPRTDAGVFDAGGPVVTTCAAFEGDLEGKNRQELTRLGFALSKMVLQGRMQAPQMLENRLSARLQIAQVGRGHAGLVGLDVLIEPDAAFVADNQFPLDVVVGFARTQLPVVGAGPPSLGAPLAVIAAQARADLSELLEYPTQGAPFVAEVSVVGNPDSRVELQIHEVLVGDLPDTILVNRSSSWVDPYPAPGPERFLVSFSHASFHEAANSWLGSVSDWRASDASQRAAIQQALASPRRDFDQAEIYAFGADYGLGWVYHRAPSVLAGTLSGLVDECCTGAGGTYVKYELTHDFRGTEMQQSFQIGGHAYYPEEACGAQRLFAAGPVHNVLPDERFTCERNQSWETATETTRVLAMQEDTPMARSRVEDWVSAKGPLLRTYPADAMIGVDAFAELGDNAPWSSPLSVPYGLGSAQLAWFRVLAVEPLGDGHRATIETTLSPYTFDHLQRHRLQLAFTCADERLLEVGRIGLIPFVANRSSQVTSDEAPDLFFVPGVIFDFEGPAARVHSEFLRQLRPSDG